MKIRVEGYKNMKIMSLSFELKKNKKVWLVCKKCELWQKFSENKELHLQHLAKS